MTDVVYEIFFFSLVFVTPLKTQIKMHILTIVWLMFALNEHEIDLGVEK